MKIATLVLVAVIGVTAAAQRQVYDPGNGVMAPVIVKEVKPKYTNAARSKKVQGSVLLQTIVDDDGSVGEVTVMRSLDSELDQEAIVALKQWEFRPGTREGKPVPVRFTCELTFTLPDRPPNR